MLWIQQVKIVNSLNIVMEIIKEYLIVHQMRMNVVQKHQQFNHVYFKLNIIVNGIIINVLNINNNQIQFNVILLKMYQEEFVIH